MDLFCSDRDLLAIEPLVFLLGGGPAQELSAGDDGAISGTTFSSAASHFESAGVQPGMVLAASPGAAAAGGAYEIVTVDSPTALRVSVLRADPQADRIAPPAGSELVFSIRTYRPQIRNVSDTMAEKLRQIVEVSGVASADFADSAQLAAACAHGVLAAVFVARAESASPADANWVKAEHYRREFLRLQLQLRLAVDSDADGVAERTRTLGNVSLRRV